MDSPEFSVLKPPSCARDDERPLFVRRHADDMRPTWVIRMAHKVSRNTVSISPALSKTLHDYAMIYARAYGQEESVVDLIPAMLSAFLDGDRAFAKARTALAFGESDHDA